MKNLNKQQIEAITDKVISELNIKAPSVEDIAKMRTEYKKEWNAFRKSSDRKVLEKYGYKITIDKVCETKTLNGFKYSPNYTYKAIDTIHIPDGDQKIGIYSVKPVNRDLIRNEIILAQLEAEDLTNLIEVVKSIVQKSMK